MEKDLEKCGCNSEEGTCGCGGHDHDDHEHECCGGHDHECGCGCGDEDESFVIDLEDENGNVVSCPIIDEFEYEEKSYYLAQNPEEDSVYLFSKSIPLIVPSIINPKSIIGYNTPD